MDSLLGENKVRDDRLNELRLRLSILKRDDLPNPEMNEQSGEQKIKKSIEAFGSEPGKKGRGFDAETDNQPKYGQALIEKFADVKTVLEKVTYRSAEEEITQRMLDAKITEALRDQVRRLLALLG